MRFTKPPRQGLGWAECDRSGFLTPAEERIEDVRGGSVRPASADITPGFGTVHPLEVYQAPDGIDPQPIDNPRFSPTPYVPEGDLRPTTPVPAPQPLVSDHERERRLREGRGFK